MKIAEFRDWARRRLDSCSFGVPNDSLLDADILLCSVLERNRASLYAMPDVTLSGEQLEIVKGLIERRARGEPIAYIIGEKEFCGLRFAVDSTVLIPRPETELLVERVLRCFGEGTSSYLLLDVGTGSGAILLSVLHGLRERFGSGYLERGWALGTDLSGEALKVAQGNAQRLGLAGACSFVNGSLLEFLGGSEAWELLAVVGNLPYISQTSVLPLGIREFEPAVALFAPDDGVQVIENLITQSLAHLRPGAVLLLEIGYDQRNRVESIAQANGLSNYRFWADLQGISRVLEITG